MKFSAIFDNRQKKERPLSGAAPPKELGHPLWRVLPRHSFTPSVVCLTIGLTPTSPESSKRQHPSSREPPRTRLKGMRNLSKSGWLGWGSCFSQGSLPPKDVDDRV